MSENPNFPPPPEKPADGLFTEPPKERSFPTAAVIVAAIAVVVVVAVLVVVGRHGSSNPQGSEAYASSLQLKDLQVSQSESYAGGKSTYVDGHVVNTGGKTVTGITVQATFAGDGGQAPQVETAPLALIRTRQPYVDTEPLSAAPLAPGTQAEFRLIFEDVNDNWNQQVPEVHITAVETR
ncbi:MAG TPA: DUF2393 family protein [Acidobacteriaceae bacterium]|nr:DUF2393 family protein [Acidobacteriaceae bacterium]